MILLLFAERKVMKYDENKVDEMILALLWLNIFDDHDQKQCWKSFDWSAMDRLHNKGYLSDPKSKAKSVTLTEQGTAKGRELFEKHFDIEV